MTTTALCTAIAAGFAVPAPPGQAAEPGAITAEALAPQAPVPPPGAPGFTLLPPAATGVDFVNPIDTQHPTKRLYLGAFACGGVAVGDVDGDGRPDLYLTSGPRRNRLYRQVAPAGGVPRPGALRFEDITAAAGVAGTEAWTAGAAMADVDADGDLDLYVAYYDAPNQLFINQGGGGGGAPVRFVDAAGAWGLAISDASLMPSFCDYDRDGDLDLFLLTRDFKRAGGRPVKHPVYKKDGRYHLQPGFEKFYQIVDKGGGQFTYVNAGRPDRLLRNDGPPRAGAPPRFTDVTAAAGLSGRDRGNSATWWDYDGDGWPDLYVGNDFKDPDKLYRNNGNGTFTDVIRGAVPHSTWFSMGAEAADVNNDGYTDLLISDMSGTNHYNAKVTMGAMSTFRDFLTSAQPRQYMRNALYLGTGTGRLLEGAFQAGLANSDWTWAVKLRDLDNDGRADAFLTNGVSRDFNNSDINIPRERMFGRPEWDNYEHLQPRRERNLAFRNPGGEIPHFEDVGAAWGLDHVGMSYACAAGDLDGDGDLDLVVAHLDEPVSIYRNDLGTGNRVVFRFRGRGANTHGYGVTVRLRAGGLAQVATLRPSAGFLSSNQPVLHFGLGAAEAAEAVEVEWPGGHVQRFPTLEANRRYTVVEPGGWPAGFRRPAPPRPQFGYLPETFDRVSHAETPYDDYAAQPLLPYQLSQLGPGIAWADVDGDGAEDFYLPGAAGHHGRLYLNRGEKGFRQEYSKAIIADKAREDLAPLFFDADADGDTDLYVVSGGVEAPAGSPLYQDRLYLNDGLGGFTAAPPGALPDLRFSGSGAAAADFDRDGDLDLAVAGRVVPGRYPESPGSRLLRNDSAGGKPKFTDITDDVPGLGALGMATSALWSDADGDGWADLFLTREWGPVTLYLNRGGKLVDSTHKAGLAEGHGWWNGIAAGDLDGDGDLDYVATNTGLNTQYHADPEHPELLFFGDMDGSGQARIIEAKFEGGICYPRRGKSCSTHAIPLLGARIKTYDAFARASLQQVYSPERLASAQRFEATQLASCALINDGSAKFRFVPLPDLAQIAPAFGVVLSDLDGDGRTDCVLAQNFFAPQPETGRMDGGLGAFLRGRGDGTFTAVWPRDSGIFVPGDAKGLAAVDLNRDGWRDLVVAVNSGRLLAFRNRNPNPHRLTVQLRGKPGNPNAAGARLTLHAAGLHTQTAEASTGSGYLSQSPPGFTFGLAADAAPQKLEVHWPSGARATRDLKGHDPRQPLVLVE